MAASIGSRLVLLAGVGVVSTASLVGVAVAAETSQAESARRAGLLSTAMSRQWNADMMHDGLRADVMAALAARGGTERSAFEVDAVVEHAATMRGHLQAAAAGAPPGLRDDYVAVIPVATRYGQLAVDLVAQAETNPAAARAALPEFLTVFVQLEESLGGINGRMQAAVLEAGKSSEAAGTSARRVTLGLGLTAVLLCVGVGGLVFRSVHRPLGRIRAQLASMATGHADLRVRLAVDGPAELAELAGSVNTFVAQLGEVIGAVNTEAAELAAAATRLAADADRVGANADVTAEQATAAAAAGAQVGQSMHTFAQGTSELGQSIAEISQNTSHAAQVAADAVDLAQTTTTTITRLGRSAAEIGSVAALIESIAKQTNLLALNATIEAARAGAAGQGFAVVAGEVKQLAQQVAAATAEITTRIGTVQAQTDQAVITVEQITTVIGQINDYQASIAGAVEQQSAVSSELTRAVQHAEQGADDITHHIGTVSQTATDTTRAIEQTRHATHDLAATAARLTTLMSAFQH